jgi:small ligand-binding sensory domain FIST
MPASRSSTLRFASALSRALTPHEAATALIQEARARLDQDRIDLAFLFCSLHFAPRLEELVSRLAGELSGALLLGCTGEGVIGEMEELEREPAIALWAAHLPQVALVPLRITFAPDLDRFVADSPPDASQPLNRLSSIILLADPFTTPVQELLSLLGERHPGVPVIGGLAGGGRDAGENRLILGGQAYDGGAVGVGISGAVAVQAIISQGCRPIGDRYVVTRAEQNVIHELGGKPALQRLQSTFNSLGEHERRAVHRALHVGIVIDEQGEHFERGDFLIRNLIGADQATGSIAVGDSVREGQTAQFHLRDARAADEDLNLLLAAYGRRRTVPPSGALLFSCCGRGQGLFGAPHHDVTVLRTRLGAIPTAGFFAQGEIGPVGDKNFVHGYTASIALFSEPDRVPG